MSKTHNWLVRSFQSVRDLQPKRSPAAVVEGEGAADASAASQAPSFLATSAAAWAGRASSRTSSTVAAPGSAGPQDKPARSCRQRLDALIKKKGEALSPRVLRRVLAELQTVVDGRVSEIEGGRRARALADWYALATPDERYDIWLLMSEHFVPDANQVRLARANYDTALGTPDEGQAEIGLRRAFASPRTRLLQRFAVFPEGMRFLVDLRAELLPQLKRDKRLLPLDAELESLFSTWFDVAFLELRRISWDSPASLIEKLIKYEAVHAMRGWADVKNRLDSDRRCYGFFHPRLPNEPLIFVEVALWDEMVASIAPLLDEAAAHADLARASHAIFYSISNTQPGLKGVSFGDSLIKHVVETLRQEFPRLNTFATLSPIPGFRPWLSRQAQPLLERLADKERLALATSLVAAPLNAATLLAAAEAHGELDDKSPLRLFLMRAAAEYLGHAQDGQRPLDAVARFHLGNGARIERINWAGDLSPKGLKQSYGLMVNYLYDLKGLDRHRQQLAQGKVPVSSRVQALYI
jgi:malonyl-CoA decarboxylase